MKVICKHCGDSAGWFERLIVYGTHFYEANGEPDGFDEYGQRGGTVKYCRTCEKPITDQVAELNIKLEETSG